MSKSSSSIENASAENSRKTSSRISSTEKTTSEEGTSRKPANASKRSTNSAKSTKSYRISTSAKGVTFKKSSKQSSNTTSRSPTTNSAECIPKGSSDCQVEIGKKKQPKKNKKPFTKWLRLGVVIGVPLLASPLLFLSSEYRAIFVIIMLSFYWVFEVVPIGIASLLPISLFPLLNVSKAADISPPYFNKDVVLFLCTLVLAMAVEECSLHRRIALKMLCIMGTGKRKIFLGFTICTGVISFFLSNTATTSLMLPICLAILTTVNEAKRVTNRSERSLKGEETSKNSDQVLNLDLMTKDERSFCKAMIFTSASASALGGTGLLTGTGSNFVANSAVENFEVTRPITYLTWMMFSLPAVPFLFTLNFLVVGMFFMGPKKLFKCKTSKEEKEMNEKLGQTVKKQYKDLGRMSFAEIAVVVIFTIVVLLWLTRDFGFVNGWGVLYPSNFVHDATIGVLACIILFTFPKDWKSVVNNDSTITPILTWDAMKKRFAWSCVLLIGCGYALSKGVLDSKLGELVAVTIKDVTQDWDPFFIQIICLLVVHLFTQFANNIASSNIFAPIYASISVAIGVHPFYLCLPAVVGSSLGLMFPMSSPPVAIVYDTGYIKMWEIFICGGTLSTLCQMIVLINMNTYAYWIMDMGSTAIQLNATSSA